MLAMHDANRIDERELLLRTGQRGASFAAHVGDVERGLRLSYVRVAERAHHRLARAFAGQTPWALALRDGTLAAAAELERRPGAARLYLVEAERSTDRSMWLLRDDARRRVVELIAAGPGREARSAVHCEMLWVTLLRALQARLLADGHLRDTEGIAADVARLVHLLDPAAA